MINNPDLGSIYRLYLDQDLITERTWMWDSKTRIREVMAGVLAPGTHMIRVETANSVAKFTLSDLHIDKEPVSINTTSDRIKFEIA
jgi:hypothetical protein